MCSVCGPFASHQALCAEGHHQSVTERICASAVAASSARTCVVMWRGFCTDCLLVSFFFWRTQHQTAGSRSTDFAMVYFCLSGFFTLCRGCSWCAKTFVGLFAGDEPKDIYVVVTKTDNDEVGKFDVLTISTVE